MRKALNVRVRLAPSPTGTLHIGTARTALFNWLFACHEEGKFLIRIEDTDRERSKNEYTDNILQGLEWLGLTWDHPPVIQSTRIENHRSAIRFLLEKGLAYRCYATDEELEEMRTLQKSRGQAPRYDNRHRNLSPKQEQAFKGEGRSSVVRFKIDDESNISWNDLVRGHMTWNGVDLGGDMVLSRRAPNDEIGEPLYNLVVVVDDADMDITHVIRGEDHIANTAKQILLYKALGLNIPSFAHTPLILNSEGRKLSKRDGVTSISDFKSMGYTPKAMTNYMALLGWSPPDGMSETFSIKEAAQAFSFKRVNKAGAKFDWDKLNWLNAQILHSWTPKELLSAIQPLWEQEGWQIIDNDWGHALAELIGPSMTLLNDGVDQARPFFETPKIEKDAKKQLDNEGAILGIKTLLNQLEKTPWDGLNFEHAKELISKCSEICGVKKGIIMKSLRATLLGKMKGPDLMTTWGLLARVGKDTTRMARCI